jgi:hypothetical protein
MMAKGLAFYHFGQIIAFDCFVHAGCITSNGERVLTALLMSKNGNRTSGYLGDGAFEYEGLQSFTDRHLTIWRFKIYGGVRMVGDSRAPDVVASNVWVTTSKSKDLGELIGRRVTSSSELSEPSGPS